MVRYLLRLVLRRHVLAIVTLAVVLEGLIFWQNILGLAAKTYADPHSLSWGEIFQGLAFLFVPAGSHLVAYFSAVFWESGKLYIIAQEIGISNIWTSGNLRNPESKIGQAIAKKIQSSYAASASGLRYAGVSGYQMLGGVKHRYFASRLGFLFDEISKAPDKHVELVLLDPLDDTAISARVSEINRGSSQNGQLYGKKELIEQILCTIETASELNRSRPTDPIILYVYNEKPVLRAFIFYDAAYVGAYKAGVHGEQTTVVKIRHPNRKTEEPDATSDPFLLEAVERLYERIRGSARKIDNLDSLAEQVRTRLFQSTSVARGH